MAKALAKHFSARLLIVDSLLLPGVSCFDFSIPSVSFSEFIFILLTITMWVTSDILVIPPPPPTQKKRLL